MSTTPTPVPQTLETFMAQAAAMELEAAQRYADLADAMETHNNREVADLFHKMAVVEQRHAEQIMGQMGWSELPPGTRAPSTHGFDSAEMISSEDVHYLMRPWHALQLALVAEERAERFFGELAAATGAEPVREAALELQREEREHVELIRAWLAKVPQPDENWADDPDPPRYEE